jgi:hypothetical protein
MMMLLMVSSAAIAGTIQSRVHTQPITEKCWPRVKPIQLRAEIDGFKIHCTLTDPITNSCQTKDFLARGATSTLFFGIELGEDAIGFSIDSFKGDLDARPALVHAVQKVAEYCQLEGIISDNSI